MATSRPVQQSASQARNEAFRRLGRNLYLIQLIEHQLKHLVVHTEIDGHFEELPAKLAEKSRKARKSSMGTLADRFTSAVFSNQQSVGSESKNPEKPWFSFSYRIEADEQFAKQRKKELRRLVRERNKLIHTSAAGIRPDDTHKWIELGAFLDAQRIELVAQHEQLRVVIKSLADAAKYSAQFLEFELLGADGISPRSGN